MAGGRTGGGRADRQTWSKGEADGGRMGGRADDTEIGGGRADERTGG